MKTEVGKKDWIRNSEVLSDYIDNEKIGCGCGVWVWVGVGVGVGVGYVTMKEDIHPRTHIRI